MPAPHRIGGVCEALLFTSFLHCHFRYLNCKKKYFVFLAQTNLTNPIAAFGGAETLTVDSDVLKAAIDAALKEKGLI